MSLLRDVQLQDRDRILVWRNAPDVAKYMFTDEPIAASDHARWFQQALVDPSRRYWIICLPTGQPVGVVNLYDIHVVHRRCCWSYFVGDPSVRGSGLATIVECEIIQYVFDELNLNKLSSEVLAGNTVGIERQKGFGFKQEGYLREHVQKGANRLDVVTLSILRSEYHAQRDQLSARLDAAVRRLTMRCT